MDNTGASGRVLYDSQIQSLFELMLDNAPIGIAYFDRDLCYIKINHLMSDINGIGIADVIGKRPSELLGNIGIEVEHLLGKVRETGKALKDIEMSGSTPGRSGRRHWLTSYYPLRGGENEIIGFGVIVSEITDRKLVQEERLLNESRLKTLLKLNEMTGAPLKEITDFAMEEGVRLTKSAMGYLAFTNEDETVLTMHSWSRLAMEQCGIEEKPIKYPIETMGLWGEAVRQRKPIITNDYAAPNPLKRGYPKEHVEVKRHMNIPVFDGDKIVAVAGVGNKEEPYDESDVRQLQLLMNGMWRLLQRKREDEALRASEEQFRLLAKLVPVAIVMLNDKGDPLFCNDRFVSTFGYTLDEVSTLEKWWPRAYPDEQYRKRVMSYWYNAMEKAEREKRDIGPVESQITCKDGKVLSIVNTVTKMGDKWLSILNDITEQKKAMEELQENKKMLQLVLDTIPVRVFWKDLQSQFIGSNKTFAFDGGFESSEQIVGKNDFDMSWKDYAERYQRDDREIIRTGKAKIGYEEPLRTPQGEIVLRTSKIPLRNTAGEIIGILGSYEDITEWKRAENALRESEAGMRTIFKVSPVGIGVVVDRVFVQVNDRLCQMTGYAREELIGQNARNVYATEDDYLHTGQQYSTLRTVGIINNHETRWKRKDGSVMEMLLSASPMDISDISKGVIFTATDVTDGKRNEAALRESEANLQSIIRAAPVGIGVTANRIFVRANEQLCQMTGYSNEELIGHNSRMLYMTQEEYEHIGNLKYGETQQAAVMEVRWRHKKGGIINVFLSSAPLDMSNWSKGITFIVMDVTDRKRGEEALKTLTRELKRKNNELESILYTASHDLRSTLVNIQGFSHELGESLKTVLGECGGMEENTKIAAVLKGEIPESLQFITGSVSKIDMILNGLLRLSRLGRESPIIEAINMDKLMANVLASMQYKIRGVGAEVTVGPLPACQGDAALMDQVFTNLIDNAIKYRDAGRPLLIKIFGNSEDGRSVYCVEDNGIGIEEQYHHKIFDAFHRLDPNKTSGEGLGLSIVGRIVDLHGGSVWVESASGRGSRFFVAIPRQ